MQCDATMRSTDSFRFVSCNFNFNYNYAMIPFFLSQLVLLFCSTCIVRHDRPSTDSMD